MKTPAIEVQGHRGARGLAAENTLAGFESALDLGVSSIETDVHLTRDDVPILFHDERLGPALVRSLTLAEVRLCRIEGSTHRPTPAADRFADAHAIPTLAEFFAFVTAYAGALGEQTGKTEAQRTAARRLVFDIELKRVPFRPETIGDGFDGTGPALLERVVVAALRQADLLERARVRSFDHRSVLAVKQLEPTLQTGILIDGTAPANIGMLLDAARAEVYCPDYRFVDADVVRQVHAAGKRIVPYTVNEPGDWQRLLAWGVDGITTDYPDRLLQWLHSFSARATPRER